MSCDKTLFASFITTHTLFVNRLKYLKDLKESNSQNTTCLEIDGIFYN
jgi:hypothetical protein